MPSQQAGAPAAQAPAAAVRDVTDATFDADVVQRSKTVPVVVDLWAEWCQPCKQLGPILERVITGTGGAVELAKVDIDKNPGVAQAFRVQSIPAVFAMVNGAVADGFVGAQGEAAVRDFVTRLVPETPKSEVDRLVEAGDERSLRAALEAAPDDEEVVTALAGLLIDDERASEAGKLLDRLPDSPKVRQLRALIRLHDNAEDTSGLVMPVNLDAELGRLLPSVKGDPDARQRFVDLLEVMGHDDPRTFTWRKRLSSALF